MKRLTKKNRILQHLRIDDSAVDYNYSLNESIPYVNLTGKSDVVLTLDYISKTDENHTIPSSFIGHYKGDGISVSVDGINWIRVTNLTKSFTGQFFSLDSIIALAITAAGSSDVSDVQMKFRQYDNIQIT